MKYGNSFRITEIDSFSPTTQIQAASILVTVEMEDGFGC
jgi:hypothetical protein